MKIFSPARLAYRQSREGVCARGLIWIVGRDRNTHLPASIGFWTGDDHQSFTINGEVRPYFGAGSLLDLGVNTSEVGLGILSRSVKFSALAPEVRQALSVYDARFARVEIHRAEFDLRTNELVDEPERVFKGFVDKVQWADGKADGKGEVTVGLMNSARALTRTLSLMFSDASQRLTEAADGFFRYVDVSGTAEVYWGSERGTTPSQTSSGVSAPLGKWKLRRK